MTQPAASRTTRQSAPAAGEQNPADASTVCGRDPRPRGLAGHRVDPVGGDLRSVLVKSHYDRHRGFLKLHGLNACAAQRHA